MNQKVSTFVQQAMLHFQNKNYQDAEVLLKKVLQVQPKNFDALNIFGIIQASKGNFDLGVEFLQKAHKLKPTDAGINYSLANLLLSQDKHEEAIKFHKIAIQLDSKNYWVNVNYAISLAKTNKLQDSTTYFKKAISINPHEPDAWSNLGNNFSKSKNYQEALSHFDRAIQIRPEYAEAWCNKGRTLNYLSQHEEALAHFERAVQLNSNYAEAFVGKGLALYTLKRPREALDSFNRAIQLKPDNAEAWAYSGIVLSDFNQNDEALVRYNQVMKLDPSFNYIYGHIVYAKMRICDWSESDSQIAYLTKKMESGEKTSPSFQLLALCDSEALNLSASRIMASDTYPPITIAHTFNKKAKSEKIRLGYYSADFHNHATAYLMAGFFESHNKDEFELVAFSFGPDTNDSSRQRLIAAFDQFVDVSGKSNGKVAELSRELGIDIAIDLKGYTTDCRPGIFACRAAPIQVNYLGYPGTMGADYIDYIIADKTVIPEENQPFFSEKIVYLPNSYQVNDTKRNISSTEFNRSELGLPETGFVFCCFNNNYKIRPAIFDAWMRILKSVENSVLWLLMDNPTASENLKKEAVSRGVSSERLIFAERMDLPDHLARHRLADLFLDTLPCNAHTTASDALWAGLPVLTCLGKTFAGKVAASLLNAIEVPELIAQNEEEYETLAIELATNPQKLNQIKQRLTNNRMTTPLFNTTLCTNHIEAAYKIIYDRYEAGLPPDNLLV